MYLFIQWRFIAPSTAQGHLDVFLLVEEEEEEEEEEAVSEPETVRPYRGILIDDRTWEEEEEFMCLFSEGL